MHEHVSCKKERKKILPYSFLNQRYIYIYTVGIIKEDFPLFFNPIISHTPKVKGLINLNEGNCKTKKGRGE